MSTTPIRRQQLLNSLQHEGRNESRLSVIFRGAIAAQLGLNVTDAECLDFLLEAGSATAGELAKKTGLSSSAMTSAIDRLQKTGYVERSSDPKDRRRVIVKPVLENLQKGERLYQSFVNDVRVVFDTMSDNELAVVVKYMRDMSKVYSGQLEQFDQSTSNK